MRIERDKTQDLIFGAGDGNRYTQDSPIMPDVWIGIGAEPTESFDLLMEPRRGVPPAKFARVFSDVGSKIF